MKGTHKHVLTITDVSLNLKRVNVCERTWCHLYCVFTYIYSLLILKDISDCQNVSVKLLCVYVCLSSRDLFIFLASSFFLALLLWFLFNFVSLQPSSKISFLFLEIYFYISTICHTVHCTLTAFFELFTSFPRFFFSQINLFMKDKKKILGTSCTKM